MWEVNQYRSKMKKTIYIAFLIIISVVHTACISSTTVDEPIGRHTFELLQKLDTISNDAFSNHFISLEELREFVKDTAIEATFRNAITTVSKENHREGLLQAYEMFKESGKRHEINWKNITFEEYVYQVRPDSGVEFHDGFLIFKHNSEKYLAKVISFEHHEKQQLFILSNFEIVVK